MSNSSPVKFKSGGSLVTVLFLLLGLNVLADLAYVGTNMSLHSLLQRVMEGDIVTEEEAYGVDTLVAKAALGGLAIFLLTVVVFCFWIYRAHKNLTALKIEDLEYTPGWAVGSYFVPFLNLVRPFQIMNEICRASSSEARAQGPTAWQHVSSPALVTLWWGAMILSGICARVSMSMFNSDQLDTLLLSVKIDMLNSGLTVCGAIFLMMIIRQIDDQQDESATMILGVAPEQSGENWVPTENVLSSETMPVGMAPHSGIAQAPVSSGIAAPKTVKVSIPLQSITPSDSNPHAGSSMPSESNPYDMPIDDTHRT